jgi:hypothetical protein
VAAFAINMIGALIANQLSADAWVGGPPPIQRQASDHLDAGSEIWSGTSGRIFSLKHPVPNRYLSHHSDDAKTLASGE